MLDGVGMHYWMLGAIRDHPLQGAHCVHLHFQGMSTTSDLNHVLSMAPTSEVMIFVANLKNEQRPFNLRNTSALFLNCTSNVLRYSSFY